MAYISKPLPPPSQVHRRDTHGTYMCIDLKTFYASVECAARGLDPFTTNLVVADPTRGEGTICLAITPAMKQLGIKNRCRLYEIPKDVKFIQVMPRMQTYLDASQRIYDIYQDFCAPCDIHQYSVDECFIYTTPYLARYHTTPLKFAQMLIDAVDAREHICATAGVGTNIFLAKIAMDIIAKRNNTHLAYLDESLFCEQMWRHRPLKDIWGIGSATAKRLEKYGVFDLYGITTMNETILYKEFGIAAQNLLQHAWGKDFYTMKDIQAYVPKTQSFSNGQVLMRDYTAHEAHVVFKEMVFESYLRLIDTKNTCAQVGLFIGYSYTDESNFASSTPHQKTMQITLGAHTNSRTTIERAFEELWDKFICRDKLVRRIVLTLGNLKSNACITPLLFDSLPQEQEQISLAQTTLAIKQKFGKNALFKATSLLDCATACTRNEQIGGHHA